MFTKFKRLWHDDQGAILSTEWVLVAAVVLFGVIPGLVATRNSVNSSKGTLANGLTALAPNYSFAGYSIDNSLDNTISIGRISGVEVSFEIDNNAGLAPVPNTFYSDGANILNVNGTFVNAAP
jgi:hypothetical protein